MFNGTLVALVTPFKDGKVNEKKLIELVEWQISEGISGLVPLGSTGESSTLSHEEHARVIEVVVKAARKRVSVLAGAGSNSTKEAISLTMEAKELGADGVLSVNPYYNRPTQEGLKAHFTAIAKAVNIPIVLYNIPFRTGVTLTADTIADLAATNKNIIGVKESTGSMDQTSEILQKTGSQFFVLSGDDSLTLPLMALGAQGVISVLANLAPKSIIDLVKSALAGNYAVAQEMHLKLFPLIKAMFIESNPGPIKAAMKEIGLLDDDSLRLPLVSVTPETRKVLQSVIRQTGITAPVALK